MDWTRRTCCSAVLTDRCCDDIKHAMRHRADCLNTYCKNMPFSIKCYVQLFVFNSDPYGRTLSHARNSGTTCLWVYVPSQKIILSAWPIIPIILSVRSCYILYILMKFKHSSRNSNAGNVIVRYFLMNLRIFRVYFWMVCIMPRRSLRCFNSWSLKMMWICIQ